MAAVSVRYFASARAASGIAEERWDAQTVGELAGLIAQRHGPKMQAILEVSTLLVNGTAAHDGNLALADSAEVDVLPPFAGG